MPIVRCNHCETLVFTVSGWADVHTCPVCGRPLAGPDPELTRVVHAGLRGKRSRGHAADRPPEHFRSWSADRNSSLR
jgi:hypothetical protein